MLREKMVDPGEHTRLVMKMLNSVRRPYSVEEDDLIGEGMIALVKAAHNYNTRPEVTCAFTTFAAPRIRGAMINFVRASFAKMRKRYLYALRGKAADDVFEYIAHDGTPGQDVLADYAIIRERVLLMPKKYHALLLGEKEQWEIAREEGLSRYLISRRKAIGIEILRWYFRDASRN